MSLVSSIIAKLKDIEKHPSGIWLTYRIAYNEEKKDKIIQYLNKTDPPMDFSYQHYGSKEEGHISFRICAYTIDQIMNLNKFLKKEKIKYEVTSYDEEYHVKLAYVLATRLVEDLKEFPPDLLDFLIEKAVDLNSLSAEKRDFLLSASSIKSRR